MTRTVGFDVSALDPAFKSHAHRGIGRYVAELDKYFSLQSTKPSESLRVAPFNHKLLQEQGHWGVRAGAALVRVAPVLRTTLRQQILYPSQLAHARVAPYGSQERVPLEVVHFPAHMDAPAWGLRHYALTVLDLIPLVCADLYQARQNSLRFRFARWLELEAIRRASIIICISANTARDVNQVLGIPWERLVVTPLGVDPKFLDARVRGEVRALRERFHLAGLNENRPIILYVGGIDPRKNVKVMLQAYREVLDYAYAHHRFKPPLLVMAGRIEEDREYPALLEEIARLGLRDDVKLLGYVPDDDLLELYAASSVFFFPSLYEGFGLPPLEALAAGLPVVSSETSAMPEVLGDAALYFDPKNVSEAARGLVRVLEEPQVTERLRTEGRERARLFTWERTGYATLKVYERLVKGI